jgi:hypothetical protein
MTPVIISQKWISKPYEDFGNRSKSRQFCRRTTTNGGATTTLGGQKSIPTSIQFSLFNYCLFLFLII